MIALTSWKFPLAVTFKVAYILYPSALASYIYLLSHNLIRMAVSSSRKGHGSVRRTSRIGLRTPSPQSRNKIDNERGEYVDSEKTNSAEERRRKKYKHLRKSYSPFLHIGRDAS
jgi:hypothetical protein